jgi:hypothetical protein
MEYWNTTFLFLCVLLMVVVVLISEHESVLLCSTCDRARLVAAQIMLLHIGAQPPPHIRRGAAPRAPEDRRFFRAIGTPEYMAMLRAAFGITNITQVQEISTRFDDLVDDRNGFAHPLSTTYINSEAANLVRAMDRPWRKPRLTECDRTSFDILSRSASILSAPRPRP